VAPIHPFLLAFLAEGATRDIGIVVNQVQPTVSTNFKLKVHFWFLYFPKRKQM
jgi:hypothetical protein